MGEDTEPHDLFLYLIVRVYTGQAIGYNVTHTGSSWSKTPHTSRSVYSTNLQHTFHFLHKVLNLETPSDTVPGSCLVWGPTPPHEVTVSYMGKKLGHPFPR